MTTASQIARSSALAVLCALSLACQPMDNGMEDVDTGVGETTQALWTYPAQGLLSHRQTVSGVLNAGNFGHYYTFDAQAGQRVMFAVEWALPHSNLLGAVIQIKNATGSQKLAEHATLGSNQAHLTYTFASAGTYRVYVKHYGYALFGSYPYKLGADPDLCTAWEGTYDGFEPGDVRFFVAANFPERITEDPWNVPFDGGLSNDDAFHATRRTVAFGNCADLMRDDCGTQGPTVFEVWFPTGTLEVVTNECEMRNDVYETAGTDDAWNLWWDTCDAYPEACGQ